MTNNRISVRKSVFLEPLTQSALSISTVTLVPMFGTTRSSPEDPFQMGGKTIITPSLSPALKADMQDLRSGLGLVQSWKAQGYSLRVARNADGEAPAAGHSNNAGLKGR